MKSVNKIIDKKRKAANKPKIKPKKEKVLIVAQEIKFARLLSGNEKKTRDRVLKSFKKWLLGCFARGYEFKEDDFIRVWKGLFYAVWMSDKPLVQEELCETIAGILDLFPPEQMKEAFLMTKAGFRVLATEWYGIDHHRMDKFLMLVRRYLRGSLRCLARCEWRLDLCVQYAKTLAGDDGILAVKTPVYARNAGSMLLHVVDCFLEEVAKVSSGDIPDSSLVELLRPFCEQLVSGTSPQLVTGSRRAFTYLLRQSEQGLEYGHRTRAWELMGCPQGGPDALELVSDSEDDGEETANGHNEEEDEEEEAGARAGALDPRAGRVDAAVARLRVPAAALAAALRGPVSRAAPAAQRRARLCLERFEQLAKDEYPLKVADIRAGEDEVRMRPARAARALLAMEKRATAEADELALRGLSRKHRKRLLAKSRAGLSIIDDLLRPNITSTNGDWAVESAETKTDKQSDKVSNKENVQKNKAKKRKHADRHKDNAKKEKNAESKDVASVKKVGSAEKSNVVSDKKVNSVDRVKAKMGNSVVINKNVDKFKSNKQIEKKSQQIKQRMVQNSVVDNVKKSAEVKGEKNSNSTLEKVVVKKNSTAQKFGKKLEKSTTKSVKEKKILNGKVEKRHQDKLQLSKKFDTPKKVKFVLKNNSMQGTIDYYKSVRQSPSIPFDSSKVPSKTNLKVSTPSPINPFFKRKLRLK